MLTDKTLLNRALMSLAAWVVLVYTLTTLGLTVGDFRFWAVLVMTETIGYLSGINGRWRGISAVMDLPRARYDEYKARWTQADRLQQQDEEDQ